MTWENNWPLSTEIDELGMSVRTINCLSYAGCKTVADIVAASEASIVGLPNAGRKTFNEIKETLKNGPPTPPVDTDELIRDLQCQVSYWKGKYEGLLAGIERLGKP